MNAGAPAWRRSALRALARLPWRWGWWLLPGGLLLALLVYANLVPPDWRELKALRLGPWEAARCDAELGAWKPAALGFGRYGDCWQLRTRFERPQPADEGALLMLGGVHQDASVLLNGLPVRHAHVRGAASQVSGALWIPLAAGLLRPGPNELVVELRARASASARVYLGSAHLGLPATMAPFQARQQWLHAGGAQSALVLLGALLLFLLPIAVARPRESLYRWVATALAASAVYVANFASSWRPLDLRAWSAVIHLSLLLATYALVRCSAKMLGERAPRWASVLAVGAALMIVGDSLLWPHAATVWLGLGYRLAILALIGALAGWWWRRRDRAQVPDGHWFAAALLLMAILGVHDALRVFLREIWTTPGYLLHWGILYTALLLFVVLLLRILDGLRQAESGRAELSLALAQRTRELENEFDRRRAAEAARTLADERARIMRDMHDGVGGQLVALIGQVQAGQAEAAQIAPQLRRTLDDLRLMIDSLDSACADLSVALGMLRARMEPLLAAQAMRVVWRTAHLPDLPSAAPATVLHVLRILQEALTNALKHAQASQIDVGADWDGARLRIVVADDGRWRDDGSGRGLASMRARAAAIGGDIDIVHDAGGTRVTLELPLG